MKVSAIMVIAEHDPNLTEYLKEGWVYLNSIYNTEYGHVELVLGAPIE